MDRFIVKHIASTLCGSRDLKSNMDRFIAEAWLSFDELNNDLKSNMDRFIALEHMQEV